jgi:hypothetical protein
MANEYLKIAEQVKRFKTVQNLMHCVNKETLCNQHKLQLMRKAVGIDGVSKTEYELNLSKNLSDLVKRMKKFGLELAEDKSKIIRFGRYAKENGSNETFDFLGFTHINGVSKNGKYIIIHQTSTKKVKSKMQNDKQWLYQHFHEDKCEIIKKLNRKIIGHYHYYGVTGNTRKMRLFKQFVQVELFKALNRRSQRRMNWEIYNRFLKYNPIVEPKIYVSLLQSK